MAAHQIRPPVTRAPRPAICQSIQHSSTNVFRISARDQPSTRPPLHPQKSRDNFAYVTYIITSVSTGERPGGRGRGAAVKRRRAKEGVLAVRRRCQGRNQ